MGAGDAAGIQISRVCCTVVSSHKARTKKGKQSTTTVETFLRAITEFEQAYSKRHTPYAHVFLVLPLENPGRSHHDERTSEEHLRVQQQRDSSAVYQAQ